MWGAGQPAQAGLPRAAGIDLAGSRLPRRAGLDSKAPGTQGQRAQREGGLRLAGGQTRRRWMWSRCGPWLRCPAATHLGLGLATSGDSPTGPREGVLSSAGEDSSGHRHHLRLRPSRLPESSAGRGSGAGICGAGLRGAELCGAGLCGAGLRASQPVLESSREQGGGSRRSDGRLDSH